MDEGRRARRAVGAVHGSRGARWLAATLVALVLLAWAASVYMFVLVIDGLSATNSHIDWWAHAVAIGIVVLTVEPLRRWLRLAVDDVVYSHFDDSSTVMAELNRHLGGPPTDAASGVAQPIDPATDDPWLARMIARTLNVPYVEIFDGDSAMSVTGQRPADREVAEVPLTYQGTEIGYLCVAPRHAGTALSNRDHKLLSDAAQQLGVALYAIRASEQVKASRAALVTAREEERRRIRRDLHDGLGPTLASMKLQLAAVSRLMDADPERAAVLLGEVRDGIDETTADIRRLVYALRPPLIDELGLIAALRNHPAAQSGLSVTVQPDQLPELPAAVEVALYRIASESLHNATRHSGGQHCSVQIDVAKDEVCMSIRDDGRGLPEPLVEGVGVSAIRERAAELGGTVHLASGGGATVTTRMPLRSSALS